MSYDSNTSTTSEDMQVCVYGWTKDIIYGIMALKNIKSSIKASYFNQDQKDAITQSVLKLKEAIDDPVFHTTRFTHQSKSEGLPII